MKNKKNCNENTRNLEEKQEKKKSQQIRFDIENRMRKEDEMKKNEINIQRQKEIRRQEIEARKMEEIRRQEEEIKRLEQLKEQEIKRYEQIMQQEADLSICKQVSKKEEKAAIVPPQVVINPEKDEQVSVENSSLQQTFDKISDTQLPLDLRKGLIGKIAESKDSFFKQASTNRSAIEKEKTLQELEEIKNARSTFKLEEKEEQLRDDVAQIKTPSDERGRDTTREKISMFQRSGSFDKGFQRSAETELSQEFRAGIKGKVAESRESYLKQISTDNTEQEKQQRLEELKYIKINRSQLDESADEEEDSKANQMRKEKILELQEIKRSRSLSRQRQEQEKLESSYAQEKESREEELSNLASRKTNFSWESNDREAQLREARAQELKVVASRQAQQNWEPENKEQALRQERARELSEIANRQVNLDHWMSENNEDLLKQKRADELREIANMRANVCWDNVDTNLDQVDDATKVNSGAGTNNNSGCEQETTRQADVEIEEMRARVRNTAAAWHQQEKCHKQEQDKRNKEVPSRRIGNLFKKDSEMWLQTEDLEDFPEPPTEALIPSNPAPPPRQSSKSVVKDYIQSSSSDTNWNAPWRKAT